MRFPPSTAGPPEPVPPGRPPAATGEQHQATREGQRGDPSPSPPSPLRPTDSPRPARGTAAPHPPRWARGETPPLRVLQHPGRGATAAVRAAVRRVPPVSRPPTPAVPAAGRQPCAGTQGHPLGRARMAARGPVPCGGLHNDEATRLGARPGRAEKRTAAERSSRSPALRGPPAEPPRGGGAPTPPPPRQIDPRAAGQTAPGARDCQTARAEHAAGSHARRHVAGHEGQQGPGATDHPPRGGWRGTTARPPPLPPTSPPAARGMPESGYRGAGLLPTPRPGGSPPSP